MIKKITINIVLIIVLAIITGCSQQKYYPERDLPSNDNSGNDSISEIESITLDSLAQVMESLVDSTVIITAYVDHVCRHGGMRMNLLGQDNSLSLHAVVPQGGERLNDSLDQQEITIQAIVREHRIDRAYLDQWEQQLDSQENPHVDEYDQIQELRQKLENNEKGYIPEYWLELEKIIQ